MSKQVKKAKPATVAQRTALFTKPFADYEDTGTEKVVANLCKSEVTVCNAMYDQGDKCIEAGIDKTESTTFKRSVDKRARPSAGAKPKTEKERIESFVAQAAKFRPASLKLLKALVAAL